MKKVKDYWRGDSEVFFCKLRFWEGVVRSVISAENNWIIIVGFRGRVGGVGNRLR